eukprot:scaffold146536_cov18-Tisochrysis_lutea.AAC.1
MTRLKAGVATGLCVLQAVCCVLMGAVQAAEERLMEAETAAHASGPTGPIAPWLDCSPPVLPVG